MTYEVFWILSAVFCALSTYFLHTQWKVSPVLASSAVTLLIALTVLPFADSSEWIQAIPYSGIGGSFIGMSTKKNVKGFETVLLAALIFGVIFIHSSQFFEGFGGALGTSACISVLTAISWRKFVKRTRLTTRRIVARIAR